MDSNFFALISRMRYIERWSLMRNSIHENIQEHSHMVAVIAHALGVIRRDVYGIGLHHNGNRGERAWSEPVQHRCRGNHLRRDGWRRCPRALCGRNSQEP